MPRTRNKSVRQALIVVANKPDWPSGDRGDMPVYEYIARNLFHIANNPDPEVPGSVAKAIRAQRIIYDRMGGTRRAGTAPAVKSDTSIEFVDLTKSLAQPVSVGDMEEDDDE